MSAARWLEERLPLARFDLKELTNEPVPRHLARWWWCLGGTPAYLFAVQIATGILLAFYYESAPAAAYDSVRYVTEEAAYGWYLRGIHKWGATLMIAAVVLHQMRVYFTGAYRRPRELNWMLGTCILVCTLALGFTGYSLVYEQLSYWGATVGANITAQVPVVGTWVRDLLLAGDDYNERTLPRFFMLHAAVLPALLTLMLVAHVGLIRLHGVSELHFEREDRREQDHYDFYPDHVYSELIVGLFLMVLLTALATAVPVTMGEAANPLATPEVIKPEWFFYVAFRWLKLFSGTAAVLSIGLILFLMFVWPFVDAGLRRWTRFQEASVWIGIAGVAAITGLTVWEAAVAH
jgi:quinol-cytochrome oxidoreductase complex cytochrome b subunit